jgi:hypothetical protein
MTRDRLGRGRDLIRRAAPVAPIDSASSPVALTELRGHPVLLLDDGHCFRDQALAVGSASEAQELGIRATSLATLAQMVAGGRRASCGGGDRLWLRWEPRCARRTSG